MSEWVSGRWSNLHNSDVWNFWNDKKFHGLVHGLKHESGVVNDQPLLDYMRSQINPAGKYGEGRRSIVAATSANTGEEVVYNSEDIPFEDWAQAVVSSASIPFVFPSQHFRSDLLMDGGMCSWGVNPAITV